MTLFPVALLQILQIYHQQKKRRKEETILNTHPNNVPVLVNMLLKMETRELGCTTCVNSLTLRKVLSEILKGIPGETPSATKATSSSACHRNSYCSKRSLDLDEKLIAFLKAIRARGGVININVVRAVAGALIECNPSHQQLSKFSMPRSWVQSIYRRMGFVRRLATTGRPPAPSGLYKECRTTYLRDISEAIKKHKIPPELILNSDQTPSSYISVDKVTMARKGFTSVAIKGVTDKRNITLTFIISLSGQFLPLQIIYGGKTTASHPRGFKFPEGFCISQNPKHWSNENETLKLIDKIINPYAIQKRQQLQLPETQKVLLIWDVFKGQMTEQVKQKLKSLNIELVAVPSNMTHFFQPLDLTVNGVAKRYMRKQFITYYSNCVKHQLENGKRLEDVEVDFRLTSIKPLHAWWIVGMYNFLTSEKGSLVIEKGWEKAGITGLLDGNTEMPSEDPFEDL